MKLHLMLSRRETIIGVGMAAGGLVTFAAKPRPISGPLQELDKLVPNDVGGWKANETDAIKVPQPDRYSQSVYEQVLVKHYFKSGQKPITLLMAYNRAQSYSSQLHRPEICYPASGFKIIEKENLELSFNGDVIPSSYLRATRGQRQDGVLYFTRLGDYFPLTLLQLRRKIAASVFTTGVQDGIVFRLSTPTTASVSRKNILTDFAGDFFNSTSNKGRQILVGPKFSEMGE